MANNKQSSGLIGSRSILTQKQIEQKYNLSPQAPVPAWVKKAIKESDDDWEGETNDLLAGKLDSLLESIRNEPEPKKKSRRKRKKASSRKMLGDVGEMGLTKSFNIILENVIESRELLFDLYKIEKQRFEFRKKIDKRLTGALDAKVREKEVEKGSGKEKENEIVVNLKKKLKRGLLETLAGGLVAAGIPIIAGAANSIKNWWDSEQDKQQIEEQKNEEKNQQDSKNTSLLMDGDVVVGRVGSTGYSTGPHIHIETGDGYGGAGEKIRENFLKNIIVDGIPLGEHTISSDMGMREDPKTGEMEYHKGVDYAIREGAPIVLRGGLQLDTQAFGTDGTGYDEGYNTGYGNSIVIKDKDGNRVMLGHLLSGPEKPKPKPKPKSDEIQKMSFLDSLLGMNPAAAGEIPMSEIYKNALMDTFRFAEGTKGSYGTIFGGNIVPELERGELTIKEVIDMANSGMLNGRDVGYGIYRGQRQGATGAYQFLPDVLEEEMVYQKLSPDTLLTPALQDRIFMNRIADYRKVDLNKLGPELSEETIDKIAYELASFPNLIGPDEQGRYGTRSSYYNQGGKSAEQLQKVYRESVKMQIEAKEVKKSLPKSDSTPPPPPLPTPKKSLYQRFMDLFSRPPAQTPQKQSSIINKDLGSKPVGTGAPQQPFS